MPEYAVTEEMKRKYHTQTTFHNLADQLSEYILNELVTPMETIEAAIVAAEIGRQKLLYKSRHKGG